MKVVLVEYPAKEKSITLEKTDVSKNGILLFSSFRILYIWNYTYVDRLVKVDKRFWNSWGHWIPTMKTLESIKYKKC